MAQFYGNFVTPYTLNGGIDAVTTSVVVNEAITDAPAVNFVIVVDTEIMLVTAKDTGTKTFTVTRAYDGSTAATHATGAYARHRATAKDYRDFRSHLELLDADGKIYVHLGGVISTFTTTAFGRSLLDDADAAAGRTTLGLGTIATQAANNVSLSGGAIDGVVIGATTRANGAFTKIGVGAAVSGSYTVFVRDAATTGAPNVFSFDTAATNNPGLVGSVDITNSRLLLYANAGGAGSLALRLLTTNAGSGVTAIDVTAAGKVTLSQGLENTVIGAVTPAAGTFTTVNGTALTMTSNVHLFGGPSARSWDSDEKAIQLGTFSHVWNDTGSRSFNIGGNAYWNGSNYVYGQFTDGAAGYLIDAGGPSGSGRHKLWLAASGTAGNTFTPTDVLVLQNNGSGLYTNDIEANQTNYNHLQLGALGFLQFGTAAGVGERVAFGRNIYRTSGGVSTYRATDQAAWMEFQAGGEIVFKVAASGTIDTTISEIDALTITNAGGLVIGGSMLQTSSSYSVVKPLSIGGSSTSTFDFTVGTDSGVFVEVTLSGRIGSAGKWGTLRVRGAVNTEATVYDSGTEVYAQGNVDWTSNKPSITFSTPSAGTLRVTVTNNFAGGTLVADALIQIVSGDAIS